MKKEIYRSPEFYVEGYIAYTVRYDDGKRTTVLKHREVVEKNIKRKLHKNEIIHHIDGNKTNNIISNLSESAERP